MNVMFVVTPVAEYCPCNHIQVSHERYPGTKLMLRIFRESRNDALAGGSAERYFKYVFGEVLLMLIGQIKALFPETQSY